MLTWEQRKQLRKLSSTTKLLVERVLDDQTKELLASALHELDSAWKRDQVLVQRYIKIDKRLERAIHPTPYSE